MSFSFGPWDSNLRAPTIPSNPLTLVLSLTGHIKRYFKDDMVFFGQKYRSLIKRWSPRVYSRHKERRQQKNFLENKIELSCKKSLC